MLALASCGGSAGPAPALGAHVAPPPEAARAPAPRCPLGARFVDEKQALGFVGCVDFTTQREHGRAELYDPEGNLVAKGSFAEGARTGEWTEWHPNGQLSGIGHYQHGQRRAGWKFFDPHGEPAFALTVCVLDAATGHGVIDVTVHLDRGALRATTGRGGVATIYGLPAGEYDVEAFTLFASLRAFVHRPDQVVRLRVGSPTTPLPAQYLSPADPRCTP